MAGTKTKQTPTKSPAPATKQAPARKGTDSPFEDMGAEDESARDARKSTDKARPLKKTKH